MPRRFPVFTGILLLAEVCLPARPSAADPTAAPLTICRDLTGFVSEVEVPGITPQQIATFLVTMDDSACRAWHPAHRRYRMQRRTPDYVGSRFTFHEVVGGYHIRGTWRVTRAEWPNFATFKRVGLPVYWNLVLTTTSTGTHVRNEMCYGWGRPRLDRILVGYIHRRILTAEVRRAIDEHDREEFLMLERMLGMGTASGTGH